MKPIKSINDVPFTLRLIILLAGVWIFPHSVVSMLCLIAAGYMGKEMEIEEKQRKNALGKIKLSSFSEYQKEDDKKDES